MKATSFGSIASGDVFRHHNHPDAEAFIKAGELGGAEALKGPGHITVADSATVFVSDLDSAYFK